MLKHLKATLAIDAHDQNGEGPAWDAALSRLIWSDNSSGMIHEAKPDGAGGWIESKRWNVSRPIGAAVPRAQGGLVVVGGTEVVMFDELGCATPFAHIDADPKIVRFNDAKCDARGRLWAGTLVHDFTPELGALYRIDPDGAVTTMLDGVTVSNGLDWSPDGATFYYVDSATRSVDAFDFDAERGAISNRRTLLTVDLGGPDGMSVDLEGRLWVAVFGSGEVRCYAPDGALLARVQIGHPGVTSCAFGGEDGGDLFITSMGMRLPEIMLTMGVSAEMLEKSATTTGGGGLFVCRPGTAGKPATPFAG